MEMKLRAKSFFNSFSQSREGEAETIPETAGGPILRKAAPSSTALSSSILPALSALFLLFFLFFLAPLDLDSRTEEDICFEVLDKKELVCVNFGRQWYIAYSLKDYVLLLLRDTGTKVPPHIWNAGRYALTHQNWQDLRKALADQGRTEACPHPEYRLPEDYAKPRRTFCSNRKKAPSAAPKQSEATEQPTEQPAK